PPPPPPPPPAAASSPPPPEETPEVTLPKKAGKIKKVGLFAAITLIAVAIGFILVRVVIPRIRSVRLPGLPGQEVTLSYWGLWEPKEVMQQVIDEFQKENPNIKVEYAQQSHKDYRERLQSALARGEGPDIFRFHNTWVPMLKDELDTVPPEVYSASSFQETFYPVAARDLRRGAGFVGVPLEIDGLALFYNKDIFKAAGKSPPTTWEDLRKTAFDLTIRDQSGRIQRAGVALGTTGNIDHWPDILGLMMLQNGANLADPTDKLAADALLFYTIFTRSDKVWDTTLPGSTQAFAAGELAMYFGPSWRVLDIRALNPDLDFAVIPVPQLPKSNITWASYWVEGVSAKSERQKDAWKFIQFLSQTATLEKLYTAAVASGRQIGEPYSRKNMAELLKEDPFVGAYITQAQNAQSWYLSSRTHDNGINDRMIKYFEDAVNAVNTRTDPQDALETTAQGISQLLSQYGIK
ncbi:extracellular solute-binding protein, partial [Patescibacteria group bacterium]|nr:extracellular solute-binding protein [Patescibacteria group bacterium]